MILQEKYASEGPKTLRSVLQTVNENLKRKSQLGSIKNRAYSALFVEKQWLVIYELAVAAKQIFTKSVLTKWEIVVQQQDAENV